MIARRIGGRSPRGERSGSSDTETLHTDVMRFVAIIGLCLTAVFALVRSLPMSQPQVPDRQQAGAGEAGSKPQDLAEVARELAHLRQQRDSTERALQQVREEVSELAPLTLELAGLRRERDQARLELDQARGRLQQLATRNQQAWDDQRSAARELARLQQQIGEQRRQLEGPRLGATREPQSLPPPEPTIANPPSPEPARAAPAREPAPTPEPVGGQSGEPGFVLRFASAAALDRLVRSGAVGFVGMQRQKTWKLSLTSGQPVFASAAKPARFHEMAPATVPVVYLRAFAQVADLAGPDGVTWGVQLPPPIEEAIGRVTRTAKGGVLVIRDDGQVVLEGHHAN